MRMPFGKYQGELIADLPSKYLEWCTESLKDIEPPLKRALLAEQRRRAVGARDHSDTGRARSGAYGSSGYTARESRLPVAVSTDVALQIVKAGRRAMAQQCHPDRGGSHELMVATNATADYLEAALPELLGGLV